MGNPSVNMSAELQEEIESRLTYGDSKSAWIREAIRLRLAVDSLIEDQMEAQIEEKAKGDADVVQVSLDMNAKIKIVEEAVKEKLERDGVIPVDEER